MEPHITAGRREWLGLAVLALPCLLYSMDLTVLLLALPSLTRELDPSGSELLWITDVYGFLLAGLLITMGRVGDRIGRRRLLMIGAAAFGAASVLAAFAPTAGWLIAARGLLGITGATLAPSTLALIRTLFDDPRQRAFAIGVWVTSFSVGAALGPLLGGVMLELWWWGSVFLLAVPVMALLLVVGPRLLPESRDPEPGLFDLPGAALSIVAVLAGVYGLKRVAVEGPEAAAFAALAVAALAAVAFVRRQRVASDPVVDLALFRRPALNAALAANTAGIFVVGGIDLFVAQHLQLVLGMGPLEAGLWTVPPAGAFVVGSLLAPRLAAATDTRAAISGGLALAAAGLLALTFVGAGTPPALLMAAVTGMSLGVAPVITLATDAIVATAPPARAGAASALSETGTELGGALGIAVLGSIGAAVYGARMGDGKTLAAAVDAAGTLPAAAGDAFAAGLQTAAGVAAVGVAVLALVVARTTFHVSKNCEVCMS